MEPSLARILAEYILPIPGMELSMDIPQGLAPGLFAGLPCQPLFLHLPGNWEPVSFYEELLMEVQCRNFIAGIKNVIMACNSISFAGATEQ